MEWSGGGAFNANSYSGHIHAQLFRSHCSYLMVTFPLHPSSHLICVVSLNAQNWSFYSTRLREASQTNCDLLPGVSCQASQDTRQKTQDTRMDHGLLTRLFLLLKLLIKLQRCTFRLILNTSNSNYFFNFI